MRLLVKKQCMVTVKKPGVTETLKKLIFHKIENYMLSSLCRAWASTLQAVVSSLFC
jgi:hypothetical protein